MVISGPLVERALPFLLALFVVALPASWTLGSAGDPAGNGEPEAAAEDTSAGSAAEDAEAPQDSEADRSGDVLANTLRWTTASEVDNFGFHVYRAEAEDGPFERLTENPIPGAGTTDLPQDYEFVDDTIAAGKPYWYYVESISMNGRHERFTPVFPAKPKGEPEAEEGAASTEEGG